MRKGSGGAAMLLPKKLKWAIIKELPRSRSIYNYNKYAEEISEGSELRFRSKLGVTGRGFFFLKINVRNK